MSKYSEDLQVEQPAIALFEELGWENITSGRDESRRHKLFNNIGFIDGKKNIA